MNLSDVIKEMQKHIDEHGDMELENIRISTEFTDSSMYMPEHVDILCHDGRFGDIRFVG